MADMTPNSNQKLDPESLVLRARPRSVVRFKRGLLIGISAAVLLAIFGATWFALGESGHRRPETGENAYHIDHKNTPDDLDSLPASYDKIKPLGPP
ncbi:MAG: conjugal transfer protein TrbI, partial [Alphaproteobacteria bacterium]|nr:conjugal transfer protein TrbI [Alphaproteobacteria bacterium]